MSFGSLPSVLGNGGGVAISVIGGTGLFADGTAAAPSISFSSAPTNGIYYAGGNEVGISNNGILRWKSTYASATNHRFQANGGGYLDATSNGAIGLAAAGTNQNITLTPSGTGKVLVSGSFLSFSDDIQLSLPTVTKSLYIGDAGTNFSQFRVGPGNSSGVLWLTNNRALFGTTTDSGALLQIGTNTTTSAGGMVFGTDTLLYRVQAWTLALDGTSPALYLRDAGQTSGRFSTASGVTYIDALNGSNTGSLVLRTGNGGGTALTLSSTQAATFAGAVTTTNGAITANSGTGVNTVIGINTSATGFGGYFRGGSTQASGKYLLQLLNYDASKNYLFYDDIATFPGAATFAGAVTVGGALKLANAYVAGAVVGTGYVTIQDSTGTTYRVPVLV